jgi:hypothetical protein
MADTIIDGTQLNSETLRFSAPKPNSSGAKSINILNKLTNSGLRISTPLMLTWGASDFLDPNTGKGNGKFEMSLQFPSDDYKNEETEKFLQNMIQFEQKIKDTALEKSKEWFGKVHKNSEVVEALWTPMLKYSKDKHSGEYDLTKAPTLRVKIPVWEGIWRCEVYDEDDNKLFPNTSNPNMTPLDYLQKGTNLAVLIQCGGLWFANGKFGITWKLIQAVVQKPKASLTGKCFIKLKASDKEKLKSVPVSTQSVQEPFDDDDGPVSSTLVDDSDAEEEEPVNVRAPISEPVVVSTPVSEEVAVVEEPKKVKKVIKKKV